MDEFRVAQLGSEPASMGPRARARGNSGPWAQQVQGVTGFNEAASARSRKCSHPPRNVARHRSFNEAASARSRKLQGATNAKHRHPASMRPRARARGNAWEAEERAEVAAASMRPRARARGNRPSATAPTRLKLLQ